MKKNIKTITANRIQLNDLDGNPRILLDASGEKFAYIHVLDRNRCSSIALTVDINAESSTIELFNGITLNSSKELGGSVAIRDKDGLLKITMFSHPENKRPIIKTHE